MNQALFLFSFSFLIVDHNVISVPVCLFVFSGTLGYIPLNFSQKRPAFFNLPFSGIVL